MRNQHCGYWCPGAKAPGHQYPQYWLNIQFIDQFRMKILHLCWTTFGKKITYWKRWPSRLRVNTLRSEQHGGTHADICLNVICWKKICRFWLKFPLNFAPKGPIDRFYLSWILYLTHWGRVMHMCVGNLTIIGSDHGLSPGRHQAVIWTNVGTLLIGPWGTNFNEI